MFQGLSAWFSNSTDDKIKQAWSKFITMHNNGTLIEQIDVVYAILFIFYFWYLFAVPTHVPPYVANI